MGILAQIILMIIWQVSGNDIMAGYGHGYGHKSKSSGLGIFSFLLMLVYLLRFGQHINHKGADRV